MSVCVANQPHNPHIRALQFPVMKTVDAMSDFGSCLSAGSAFPDPTASDACWDVTPMEVDTDEVKDSDFSFWILPPELRTMVYRELLLSDSAFRLGHHGPYSHESRRQLYPQILRACQWIFMEASEVLYGDNTFYLGPIGHKPTYSASFTTSIGTHNAVKLRTLVAHCTHVSSLTERYLRNWISSFGLDIDRLKVLAISFSPSITGESVPSTVMSSMGMNHHHNQQPQLQTQTAFAPFIQALQATQTHQPIRQQTSAMTTYLGVPGGGFSMLANVTIHPSGAPPPPATTVVGSSPITTPSTEREEAEKIQLNFALMESRMQSWLIRTPRKQVDQWVQIKNTDLRAGERWLLYVCPTLQAMRNLRF